MDNLVHEIFIVEEQRVGGAWVVMPSICPKSQSEAIQKVDALSRSMSNRTFRWRRETWTDDDIPF